MRKTIQILNSVVNYGLLVFVIVLLLVASYALWDSKQLYAAASQSNYTAFRPTAANEGRSFKELQALNPEVFSWITVYGTHIDYPVVQAKTNMKYVNTNAEGSYSLSGAIFLDCDNNKDFSDFVSILYGHHMQKQTMFGEVGSFVDRAFFDSHQYGNLYFDGRDHGIEFFAFLHIDAYDKQVLWPNVSDGSQQVYLDNLMAQAIHVRNIRVAPEDHLVLLTTCSPRTTNGRDVLVGRISNEVFENPFPSADSGATGNLIKVDGLISLLEQIPLWAWPLLFISVFLLLPLLLLTLQKRRRDKQQPAKQEKPDATTQKNPQVQKIGGRP